MIVTLISNVLEAQATFNSTQMDQITKMQQNTLTESKALSNQNVGTGLVTGGWLPLEGAKAILKSFTMDYSFLFDVFPAYTAVQCAAISNSKRDALGTPVVPCQVPNIWYMPFMLLLWGPISVVSLYFVIYLFRG
jgi:hypothetical protein